MKTTISWLILVAFLFCSLGSLRADSPTTVPKWYYDLFSAYSLYVRGSQQTATDPAAAVETLKNATTYVQLAFSEGASTQAIPLAQAIAQALAVAEDAKVPATPVVTTTAPPRNEQPKVIPAKKLIARKG